MIERSGDWQAGGKGRNYEVVGYLLWPLLHGTFLINFFLTFPNIYFSSVPVFFVWLFVLVSWAPASKPSQGIRRSRAKGDHRREVQDKSTFPDLAVFSDHRRKRRWSLYTTFLCPDASNFFYTHSLSPFLTSLVILGGLWGKDIQIKWVYSIICFIPLQVVNFPMFSFYLIHFSSCYCLHLIKPKLVSVFSTSGPS